MVEENRDLRNELENLRSFKNKEEPKIEVTINDKNKLTFKIQANKLIEFNKVDINSIPKDLAKDISSDEIERYNDAVERKREELDSYIKRLNEFESKKESHQKIKISVSNIGKTKANDVYVDITFPTEIKVFEKN